MENLQKIERQMTQFAANNYHPLPVNIVLGQGAWVWTSSERTNDNKYLDCLAAYGALNQGYNHPRLTSAAMKQLATGVTVTSRAFLNEPMADLCELISEVTTKEKVLLMNTGAEAVESAIKIVRKWGKHVKKVDPEKANIITCCNNFHGRTITIVSFSSEEQYRDGFGPFTPGFKIIEYGNIDALKAAIDENTVGFLVEPAQGEAGIIFPPEGFLTEAQKLCAENDVLLMADCIQSGFGRTGRMFACDWDGVIPDLYIMGKAIGGGFPLSAVACDDDIMSVLKPGDHGSTFGGNPFCSAVAIEAIKIILEEELPQHADKMGQYFMAELEKINSPHVKEIRGRGLWIGVELHSSAGGARRFCEALAQEHVLCKETHHNIIRVAPPLVITKDDIDWALDRFRKVLLMA